MNNLWKYIEAHHEEYGVALFIIPALVLGLVVVAVICAVSALVAA